MFKLNSFSGPADAVVVFNGAVKTDPVPVPGVMVADLGVILQHLTQMSLL